MTSSLAMPAVVSVSRWTTPSSSASRLDKTAASSDRGATAPPPCGRFPDVKRTAALFLAALATLLVGAPAALADNGTGLAGHASDKTITLFCFGVMLFFVALVVGMSLIQRSLEKRKERRHDDLGRFG